MRTLSEVRRDIKDTEAKLAALMAEDRTDYAQGIIDKMFQEFKSGGRWTSRMKDLAEKSYHVFAPNGRKRNLFAAMTEDRKIVAKQVRRGANAPIQGFASEIAVKAGRVVNRTYFKELPKFCELLHLEYNPWKQRILYNRAVHDANYYSVPYALVIPYTHVLQWGVTYGITEAYKKEFNIDFTVEPEIEIEFGSRDDKAHKWDWSLPSIVDGIVKSVSELEELDRLEGKKDDVLRLIFRPWKIKESRHYLQKHYPLLNVPNLDTQIREAIRPIYHG